MTESEQKHAWWDTKANMGLESGGLPPEEQVEEEEAAAAIVLFHSRARVVWLAAMVLAVCFVFIIGTFSFYDSLVQEPELQC